jgi:hypothetical protein
MWRIEIEFMYSPGEVFRNVQIALDERPVDSSALPLLLTIALLAKFPPAAALDQSSVASGPRRSRGRLRARNASSVSGKNGTVISPEREVVTHEDAQTDRTCQAEALVVCVANSDCESASFETGFEVESAEHLHRVARYRELLPHYSDVAVTQGFN